MAAKKTGAKKSAGRSGPRAPAGKKPLVVIIDEQLIEDAKVAAIRDKRKVSGIVEELLSGWLARRKSEK